MHRFILVLLCLFAAHSAVLADTVQDEPLQVLGDRYEDVVDSDRATARTTQKELEERQPQSTPAALIFLPAYMFNKPHMAKDLPTSVAGPGSKRSCSLMACASITPFSVKAQTNTSSRWIHGPCQGSM